MSLGSFRFTSTSTRKSEKKLFAAVQSMMAGMGKSPGREQMISLQRSIKKELMRSPYDLRGSRRTFVLLTFIKVRHLYSILKVTHVQGKPGLGSMVLKEIWYPTKMDKSDCHSKTVRHVSNYKILERHPNYVLVKYFLMSHLVMKYFSHI